MAGIFNQNFWTNPMLAGSLGMMAAGGPSRMPVSLGQGLLSGFATGSEAYQRNLENQQKAEAAKLRRLQVQQIQQQLEQAAREQRLKEQAMASLTPEQQALVRLHPATASKFAEAMVEGDAPGWGSGRQGQSMGHAVAAHMRNWRAQNQGATPEEALAERNRVTAEMSMWDLTQPKVVVDQFGRQVMHHPPRPPVSVRGQPPGMTLPTPAMADQAANAPSVPGAGALTGQPGAPAAPAATRAPGQPGNAGEPLTEEDKRHFNLPINSGWVWGADAVPRKMSAGTQETEGERQKGDQLAVMSSTFDTIDQLLEAGADPSGSASFDAFIDTSPVVQGIAGKAGLDLKPQMSKQTADLYVALELLRKSFIQMLRGANVGPKEEESFLGALPVFGTTRQSFNSALEQTRRNVQILKRRIDARKTGSPMSVESFEPRFQREAQAADAGGPPTKRLRMVNGKLVEVN
jgi:hypothetical protein